MSRPMRYAMIAVIFLLIAAALTPVLGFRLFVIAPRPGIPDGFVAIVRGANFLRPFDSPEWVCRRWGSAPSTECVTRAITEVNRTSSVLTRLPYVPPLATLAGVPDEAR